MATVTLGELIERARDAADMTDDFPTRETFVRWLNVDRARLDVMIARHGMVYNLDREDITADGSLSYEFTQPIAIVAVYELDNQGRYRRLRAADAVDGRFDVVTTGAAEVYKIDRTSSGEVSLTFWPIPASGTYQVYVIPASDELEDDGDTVDYPMAWEEWLVLSAARRALAKEESSTAEVMRQMRELESHIETAAWDQQLAANQKVRNVDRVERGWCRDLLLPPVRGWGWGV